MMRTVFGQSLSDSLGLIVARHWALLIFLVGGLLVYAAYRPEIRVPALIVAVVEKQPSRRLYSPRLSAAGGRRWSLRRPTRAWRRFT